MIDNFEDEIVFSSYSQFCWQYVSVSLSYGLYFKMMYDLGQRDYNGEWLIIKESLRKKRLGWEIF